MKFFLNLGVVLTLAAGVMAFAQDKCDLKLKHDVEVKAIDLALRDFVIRGYIADWQSAHVKSISAHDTFQLLEVISDNVTAGKSSAKRPDLFNRVIVPSYVPFMLIGKRSQPPLTVPWRVAIQGHNFLNYPEFRDPKALAEIIVHNYGDLYAQAHAEAVKEAQPFLSNSDCK